MMLTSYTPLTLLLVCVLGVWAATSTPKPTRESSENENLQFTYSAKTHQMYIKMRERRLLRCYIAVLTDAERNDVHTDAGLRTLELKVLGMLAGSQPLDAAAVSADDVRACGHAPKNGTVEYYSVM